MHTPRATRRCSEVDPESNTDAGIALTPLHQDLRRERHRQRHLYPALGVVAHRGAGRLLAAGEASERGRSGGRVARGIVSRSAQRNKSPRQSSVRANRKLSRTRRCAAIRARDAARVQKPNPIVHLIARHVGVAVQQHVHIFRRLDRRDMHKAKLHAPAFEIEHERPCGMAVAIPAHNRHGRTELTQLFENRRRADIAQVPDFIRVRGQLRRVWREVIVRIGENKNPERHRRYKEGRWLGSGGA